MSPAFLAHETEQESSLDINGVVAITGLHVTFVSRAQVKGKLRKLLMISVDHASIDYSIDGIPFRRVYYL